MNPLRTLIDDYKIQETVEIPVTVRAGFVSCPPALIANMTGAQMAYQQWVYQQAYAQAWNRVGFRPIGKPQWGRESRN